MSVDQGEYPGLTPEQLHQTAPADRDNAGEGPVVGSPAAPGADTVTLSRPLCVDAEFYPGEWETRTGILDTTGATA